MKTTKRNPNGTHRDLRSTRTLKANLWKTTFIKVSPVDGSQEYTALLYGLDGFDYQLTFTDRNSMVRFLNCRPLVNTKVWEWDATAKCYQHYTIGYDFQ